MTAQIRDRLMYNDNEYRLAVEPLHPYLKGSGITLVQLSTACQRGYVADWLIEDDKLYLVGFKAFVPATNEKDGMREVGMEFLFPGQDKVLAKWFSGVLCIPHGNLIRDVHQGYASIYEKELYLRFVEGKYVSWREVDNSCLKSDRETLKEREMDGIWEAIFGVERTRMEKKSSWLDKFLKKFKR